MTETKIDLSKYHNSLGRKHQIIRLLWSMVWGVFAHPLPRNMGSGWKRFLLRRFGARIHPTAVVYSSAKVYYPANLEMEANSCLASGVTCYNVDPVKIGANTTVSQEIYLCTAARASVFKDVKPWTVVGGNPAKFIKMRKLIFIGGGKRIVFNAASFIKKGAA